MNICAVIMAGGSGSRLWPISRAMYPKQFLKLEDEKTLLQAAVGRVSSLDVQSSIIICNEEHRFFVAEQLRQVGKKATIILEPEGKNTAPAIALAALKTTDDPLLLLMSSDHLIQDEEAFNEAVESSTLVENNLSLLDYSKPSCYWIRIHRRRRIKKWF